MHGYLNEAIYLRRMVFKINYPFMISPVLPEAQLDADYQHKGIK